MKKHLFDDESESNLKSRNNPHPSECTFLQTRRRKKLILFLYVYKVTPDKPNFRL